VNDKINKEENGDYEKVSKRIEADKKMFVGCEIEGKTLGVVGLGQIGGRVVEAALALGMKVVGYDPVLSLDAAWRLPGDRMTRANSLEELLVVSDYVTLHVPYIKDATHHLLNDERLSLMKSTACILNFARGEIVDGEALKAKYDSGAMSGRYISDFSDPFLMGHPKHLVLPHLGASTEEAEENSAAMAAETIKIFLETGSIRHSVNFPNADLPAPAYSSGGGGRLCVVNKNEPGVLGEITTFLGSQGLNISQELNTSRGNIAYTVIDFSNVPEDPDAMQDGLAKACSSVISSRFIGTVFEDQLGQPGSYFKVSWAD
jgi:D-3-phosphoglycerate dehydrogenase